MPGQSISLVWCQATQEAQRIGISGLPSPWLRIAVLPSLSMHGSRPFLLRLAPLARMNDSLIQAAYPLSLQAHSLAGSVSVRT
ncbi:MAG: hypothetical protein M1350_07995 [Actinobacteria bacterium]|nr:hypothetical protein [Actinomycetota bacterium]